MAVRKNPISEANRYMENARSILSEKGNKKDGYYQDAKYVRMAGNCAWNGVLLAIEAITDVRKKLKKGQRLDIQDYKNAVLKKDKKMDMIFLAAYESLHKALGYDGNPDYRIVNAALSNGQKVIDWAAKHYSAN